MSAETIGNYFASVWVEYDLPLIIIADFVLNTSVRSSKIIVQRMESITLSSPYHHQAKSSYESSRNKHAIMEENIMDDQWYTTW